MAKPVSTMSSGMSSGCQTACAPTAGGGCLRCEHVPGREGGAVLFAAADIAAASVVTETLTAAGFTVTEIGPVMRVTGTRQTLSEVAKVLRAKITPYTQSAVRGAYVPGGRVDSESDVYRAMMTAEPLSTMLANWEHEWVRDALDEGWLFSVFHPILDARTGSVFAQEALLRARDPIHGTHYGAGQIIGACDALNLQHQLDQRARRCAIYNAAKHVPVDQKVFINFLPNTIYDPVVCLRTTVAAAKKFNVDMDRLVFEVVETERIPDMDRLLKILDYYRDRGVGTAVDDMGAGFSTVEYIEALKPDYVKLDRDLVVRAEHDRAAQARVRELVDASHSSGAKVVAEGIETPGQLDTSIDCGADYLQGFLFAKPARPPAAVTWPTGARKVA